MLDKMLMRLMQDAQIDTDGSGDAVEDAFDELLGDDMDLADYVTWYGILAFGLAGGSMVLYFILPETFAWYYGSLIDHQKAWWPVAWSWLLLGFWDNEHTRALHRFLVLQSLLGPFKEYWVFLGELVDIFSTTSYWSNLWSWVNLAIVLVYNVISVLFQVFFIPKVYEWIDTAPYYNEEYEGEPLIDQAEEEEMIVKFSL